MRPPVRDPNPGSATDSQPESEDAVTPRGGFMARPGLKRPPQHAVVVRVGDVPPSEHIPLLRSSVPPPPPADDESPVADAAVGVDAAAAVAAEPAPDSESQKVTLRALSTPSAPPATPALRLAPSRADSAPPPSDMPVVASVPPAASQTPHVLRSRWAIALAAAAGLVLGFASVATTTASNVEHRPAAAPPPLGATLPQPLPRPAPAIASMAPIPSAAPAPLPKVEPAARPASSTGRRTIF